MAKFYLSVLLFRFVLPASVLLSIALRPFGVSLLYLLLYLWLPFLPLPTAKTFGGVSGKALLLGTVLSFIALLAHPAWHIMLVALPPYGTALGEACSWPARIAQNLGFVPFVNIPWRTAVRLTIPELIMTVSTLFIYIIEKKICSEPSVESKGPSKYQRYPFLTNAGKYIALFLIMFSGVLRPSVTSGIYFLVFIGLATWWSCGKELDKVLAVVGRCVVGIMAVHLLLLMAYQCSWIVELLPEKSEYARYFGFTRISVIACDTGPTMNFAQNVEWATFVSPLVIAVTYYVLVLESSELLKPKVSYLHDKKQPAIRPTETTPLIRGLSPSKRSKKWSARNIHQDSTGSVMMPEEDSGEEAEESGLVDHLVLAIIGFFHVLIRSSYILTTIIMMAWSIMFHSWLTFILLIWGNLVWLVPNQRAFMLRTSPVLVAYAVLLLISQYVYGMDLLATELPSNVDGVNLAQIGLERPAELPCIPLLIKSMMTVMFWVTLRQRNQESRQRRQSSVLADMASPLQVTVGTAASVLEEQCSVQESPLLVKCGEWLRWFCTWYWIYVVVIMLFAIGITGERMTIFRIVYMFMFLYFILLFQISWKWWRKLMYAFWVALIIYSMINLVLVYIYQFDNFAENIQTHVGISMKFQTDLGLEKFKTSELFVRLVTPTFFLVITVIQLHYFHKDFLENSKLKSRGSSLGREDSVLPSQSAMSTQRDDLPGLSSSEEMNDEPLTEPRMSLPNDDTLPHASLQNDDDLPPASLPIDDVDRRAARHTASLKRRLYKKLAIQTPERYEPTQITYTEKSSLNFKEYFQSTYEQLKVFWLKATNLLFLYLEIHLIKIVFLSLMLLCVFDVCGLHVPIMLVISPVLLLDLRKQRVCVLLLSTLISAYFMAKMIFQLAYIEYETFDVNCTSSANITNNAKWMGFLKASKPDKPLPTILKGYIGMLAVFTAHSIVKYRQQNSASVGITIPGSREKIMFPGVTRKHADLDCVHCLKYLFNYGFYKFGVEVTLMCLIGVIGSRMDVYGLLYAGWLCALVCVDRDKQAQLWGCFTWCVALLVPLQYILAVGVLPQFCLEYPWGDDEKWGNYRRWFFLPYAEIPPPATKIVFDYFLLLFAARQRFVFRSERRRGAEHPGGSNAEDAGHLWETPDFVNPVPDFLTYVDSWLDVIKRIVFMGMLWVTLAIMFLTGTNRVNLFSMGYLIGSFVFLWQGTDLFLRPKKAILTWWSWLLRFNVGVIVIKTVFQIPGCLFGEILQSNACWLVQLLGVGCVDKFMGGKFTLRQVANNNDHECSVPQEDIGLAWDGVCFAFLLLHRRLFHSYYFYRIIDESKATTILASRGAELIDELRDKQMKAQEEQEAKILDKIKVKMERIKANQKKIQGPMFKAEFPHHQAETLFDRPLYQKHPPTSHQKAIRSGDYYMFDLFDETDILSPEDESSSDEDAPRKLGVGEHYSEVDTGSVDLFPRETDRSTPLPEEQDTLFLKIRAYILIAWAFIESIIISMTRFLKKYSRDYRYVSRVLSNEKKLLKEREGFGIGIRTGRKMIWTPAPDTNVKNRKLSELSVPEIRILAPSMERGLDLDAPDTPEASPQHLAGLNYEHRQSSVYSIRSNDSKDEPSMEDQEDQFHQDKSPVVHFLLAVWYAVLSHTDIVCYLMVFINQIQSATILSIPLPLMVFLWGSLTIPRPSKTFWVTLIAYTEVIVLIKSMFQFEILPWNQQAVPPGMPFTAPRIIGIERKFNYAFYDLLLLLVIFFHRYMLKSLGLWKSGKIESVKEMQSDAYYQLQPSDAEMIQQGGGEAVGRAYAEKHLAADKSSIQGSINESEATSSKWTEQTLHRVPEVETHAEDDHDIPSTSFQVDTIDKNDDHTQMMIGVTTEEEAPVNGFPKYVGLAWQRYVQPVHKFYADMLDPTARVTADVYAQMFMCDFFNFLVVIFGFAAFGTQQGDGGVKAYLEENKVPIPFLIMLILQFGLIIVDRALYLRKYILGKILFQIILIVGVHIWMFFVLPFITERTFNNMLPPPMWYMVKCIYLLLSAYQIRCGYPNRIHGNFLCKGYGYVNMFLFRGFMLVPFVFELRALMDWIWTDTSMTLMDWLKMEDIFSNVFLLKCSRSVEDEYPQPRGSKKALWSKYLMGGSALACIIALIWFPLVVFAFGNTVGVSNPPYDVTVKLRLGEFSPAYTMSVQKNNIRVFSPSEFDTLSNVYRKNRAAQTFLANYVYDDVAAVTFSSNSSDSWDISPPELQRLRTLVTSNSSLTVQFSYIISHTTNNKENPPLIEDEQQVVMPDFVDGKPNPDFAALALMLDGKSSNENWFTVKMLFPKFLKVFNKGLAKPVNQLMFGDDDAKMFRNIRLQLHRESGTVWWQVQEDCTDENHQKLLQKIPSNNCDNLVMFIFNDKLFPETLNFISGSGIIGLYTTFVFVASRVLRSFFNGICFKIMFEDLPNVDRVLQLCLDIYLVREAAELVLEEDLFAKLVFLYRSPETMIKWTRPDEPDEEASRAIEAPQAPAQR